MSRSFGPSEAAHLLRRAAFGGSPEAVARAVRDGREATLERLLGDDEGEEASRLAAAGERLAGVADLDTLQALWLTRMIASDSPGREKLTLFWHGHFATSQEKVQSMALMWRQMKMLRDQGQGSFEALVKAMARDPAMLLWLDGNRNRRGRPNENFARELMELFTLGVGHYTEQDVQEAARAFGGWHVRNGAFWLNVRAVDDGEKVLFGARGAFDGDAVVERCVARPECATFITDALLRFYVHPEPREAWRQDAVAWWNEHDGNVGQVVRRILSAPWFDEPSVRRARIKSPVELTVGTCRMLGVRPRGKAVAASLEEMGQSLFAPPSVAGWAGGRAWISSHTLLVRERFARAVAFGGEGMGFDVPWAERLGEDDDASRVATLLARLDLADVGAETRRALTQEADTLRGEDGARRLAHLALSLPECQTC